MLQRSCNQIGNHDNNLIRQRLFFFENNHRAQLNTQAAVQRLGTDTKPASHNGTDSDCDKLNITPENQSAKISQCNYQM
ncbi:hypothetical protein T10_9322 [Trichinella papuae]|uniref:Uncharacterized protein n=1 Tax=Trichinella papuae TaxID=268474 RepID=A0A0V1M6T5_9BILA|nr:hypothetical protein T10_9322 [Trichinella papuae]